MNLTELEGAVLGTVWREAPVTAYGVRALFADSLTSSWTASTGSVYPAIRRLRERNLIASAKRNGDGRATRELSVTKPGLAALRDWIRDIDAAIGIPTDPLRSRMQFLGSLDSRSRRRWASETSDRLNQQIEPINEALNLIDAGSEGDPAGSKATWVRRATLWTRAAAKARAQLATRLRDELDG